MYYQLRESIEKKNKLWHSIENKNDLEKVINFEFSSLIT